jgi:probable HAF family extracellular repeat protein
VEDLGTLGGTYSYGFAINGRGQVAGSAESQNGLLRAFRTDANGQMTDAYPESADMGLGYGINDAGQVAGYTRSNAGVRTAFRTNPVTGKAVLLSSLGGSNTRAYAINNTGQVTGSSVGSDGVTYAFRVEADGRVRPDALALQPQGVSGLIGAPGDSSWK